MLHCRESVRRLVAWTSVTTGRDVVHMWCRLLHRDPEGRRRKLSMRTYAVVCLNEECGLLQWVANTSGFRSEVSERVGRACGSLVSLRVAACGCKADHNLRGASFRSTDESVPQVHGCVSGAAAALRCGPKGSVSLRFACIPASLPPCLPASLPPCWSTLTPWCISVAMQRRAAKYDSEIACHFPILFHKWFLTKFRDPTAWFESR